MRVDADAAIGSGHVMRCLALAQRLRAHGASVSVLSRPLPPAQQAAVAAAGVEPRRVAGADDDAAATVAALGADAWDWMIVDHYGLDARWESRLRERTGALFVIDDLADRPHDCDMLLDQNVAADAADRYSGLVPAACRLLLGPRFALLREEFAAVRATAGAERPASVERLLIAFGGSDPGGCTRLAIEAVVASVVALSHVDVVIGGGHPDRAAIEAACATHGFVCHVQSTRMAELMAAADLAIGAGGVTTWERCCLGLPAIAWPVAANQRQQLDEAGQRGLLYVPSAEPVTREALARWLAALVDSPVLRRAYARAGRELVDGHGADRVARLLVGGGAGGVRLRAAGPDDALALHAWRNHKAVREMSRDPQPIAWPAHAAWLERLFADPDRFLLIGEHEGEAVGVVRFDVAAPVAEVSIYRVPGAGVRGLGAPLLAAAEAWLMAARPDVARVTAEVLADNDRSRRLFEDAGYRLRAAQYEKPLHG